MAGRKKPIASGEPRKRTEAVLLDERERLRIIFDTVGDPIFVKDNASRMILVNQSFYAVFGLDEQAVIGHTLAENVPPEERQFLEVDRRVLDTGQPDEREEALTVNGKATKYIVTRKRRFVDQSGNRFLVGSMHDITARKQAESAVVVTRNALQNVFDLVPDMICIASPNGFFLDVNPAFSSVLGYTREHLLATPYLDMMHPDDRAPTQQEIQRQLTGKATANFVNRYRCKDGTYKTLEWFATPNVGGVLYAAARDITDRRNAEESRLQFAQKVMNVREEEKKALAGILHHDIGSLTVGVMSRLDALEEDIREGKTRAALQWLKQAKRLFTESMAHFK